MRTFRRILLGAILSAPVAVSVSAQNLTADEINNLIDDRVNNLNPYQAILNDPDPERALAGMQIMLDQGDETLRRMALEYGLLSPNPTVQRIALEGFLNSNPVLSIRIDGTQVDDEAAFRKWIPDVWNGTVDGVMIGYWRINVDGFNDDAKCYVAGRDCFITVNSDGVFFTPSRMNGRAEISDEGTLAGSATFYGVEQPVPFSVQLLD